ncbi:hypothetical protein DITRI_Ditri08aG0118200 [Diplodiscus trichospermus]
MQNPEQARERFSKRLTEGDVGKCLIVFPICVVTGIFDFNEGHLFFMDVVGSSGSETWKFLGSFSINEEMGPIFSISCPNFVKEKALKADDEVVFIKQPMEDEKAPFKKFKIEVKRKIRLFGKDIWGDLMV